MRFTIISSYRAPHQLEHQRAVKAGFDKLGIETKLSFNINAADSKHVVCWGWRMGRQLREMGKEVLVMERGYLADRFHYSSMAWNGLNGHARFPYVPSDGGGRFDSLGLKLQPWTKAGEYVVIFGQVPTDASLSGRDLMPWYIKMAHEVKEFYGIPVLFRQHPDLAKKGLTQRVPGTDTAAGNLQEVLKGAALAICWNSNSAVDAILAGIPTVAGDKGTMAFDMCSKNINHIKRPCREEWAHSLAWKQWSIPEIESGLPLRYLLNDVK